MSMSYTYDEPMFEPFEMADSSPPGPTYVDAATSAIPFLGYDEPDVAMWNSLWNDNPQPVIDPALIGNDYRGVMT
jgi:hypothetical protein